VTSDVIGASRRAGECIDGRYQLDTEIGAGGLGSVYRATQTKLARQVAVKLLHESMGASEVQRARFEREARALAALEHPNIVSILDYGVADGQPYIVTELLEGETLAERLHAGSLPLQQGLRFADELLDALAFMHEAGVVHRDLKASNVFLQRVHGGERVKLLDFGLAKTTILGPGAQGDATLTRDGTVVGTPAYMSPEQATGDVVDARSDVYAVGVLLYQMLTGRLPFVGDAIDQVRSHLVEPVPALERTSPSRKLDAALERLIKRAMAKKREERFENARAMWQALTQIQLGAHSSLPPPKAASTERLRRAARLLPSLGGTLRFLRALCVMAVVFEAVWLVLLWRDAQGKAALSALSARSRVVGGGLVEQAERLRSHARDASGALPGDVERTGSAGAAAPLVASAAAAGWAAPAPLAAAERVPAAGAVSAPQGFAGLGSGSQLSTAARGVTGRGAGSQLGAAPRGGAGLDSQLSTATRDLRAQPVAAELRTPERGPWSPLLEPEPHDDDPLEGFDLRDHWLTPTAAREAVPARPEPAQLVADPGVPGPPKLRNPWARGTPPELRGIRKSLLAGGAGDDRVAGALRSYTQSHPGDPRGQLLLGVLYMNRNWRADAVAMFASALKTDLSARGAPEVLDSLTELVASGKADAEASALIMRAYGTEALPALASKIAGSHAPDAVARLRALRARIDRASGR
jgi:eukaryotic-like serine/threonine-protein kinase